MIAVEHHGLVGDVGDDVQVLVVGVGSVAGHAVERHADLELVGKVRARHQHDALGVVVAEAVLGLEVDAGRVARAVARERFLDAREDGAVTPLQVGQFALGGLERVALGIEQPVAHRHPDVVFDQHHLPL